MDSRSAAQSIIVGWLRRYARAGAIAAAFALVVVLMPSTIPRVRTVFEAQAPAPASPLRPPSVALTSPVAPPSKAPAVASVHAILAPLLATPPPASVPSGHAPPPITPPMPGSSTTPTCPVSLPGVKAGPTATPVLLDFLPLAGPFGPEALGFLPVIGPLLPSVTPLLPVLNPTLAQVQPQIAQAVSGAVLVEQVVFGPVGPEITSFTPESLSGEKEVVALLQPVTTAIGSSPAVGCVYELTSAAAALLLRGAA